jgi:hypothetical protein
VIEETLRSGEHWNPGLDRYPGRFTTAYFHQPVELATEIAESGLILEALIGIEGPGEFVGNGRDDPLQRSHIFRCPDHDHQQLREQEHGDQGDDPEYPGERSDRVS